MHFTVHTITRITPSARTGRDRVRDAECEEALAAGEDADATPADASLPVPRRPVQGQDRRERPPVSGELSAQLISQRLRSKSERRLAMLFPERINSAYRNAAALGRAGVLPRERKA